jgi:hypothetical protein
VVLDVPKYLKETTVKTFLGLLIMFLMPLLFFWVPVVGLIAGALGGYLIGRPVKSVLLALVPFCSLALLVALGGFGFGLPLVGVALAGVALAWLVVHSVLLLAGAFLGGLYYTLRHGSGRDSAYLQGYHAGMLRSGSPERWW